MEAVAAMYRGSCSLIYRKLQAYMEATYIHMLYILNMKEVAAKHKGRRGSHPLVLQAYRQGGWVFHNASVEFFLHN